MRKIKYNSFVTRNEIDGIILKHFPNNKCPECGQNGVCAGCIEDQYDEKSDEYVYIIIRFILQRMRCCVGKMG